MTEAGKKNSARNSFRHGLLAETVVLEEESTERFLDLLAELMDEHQPSTATQVCLVETMAVARWRQLRVCGAQKTAMDRDMALQVPAVGPATVRILAALRGDSERKIMLCVSKATFCAVSTLIRGSNCGFRLLQKQVPILGRGPVNSTGRPTS